MGRPRPPPRCRFRPLTRSAAAGAVAVAAAAWDAVAAGAASLPFWGTTTGFGRTLILKAMDGREMNR